MMRFLPRHLQQLEATLTALTGFDDDAMLPTELDGFITGLVVCPDAITPGEWLPVALGHAAADRSDPEDSLQDCIRLVFEHYDMVARALQGSRGGYTPVFDLDRQDEILWELWMDGFDRAMAMRPDVWRALAHERADEEAAIALAGMKALIVLATQEGQGDPEWPPVAALTDAAPRLIPVWVEALNGWRLRRAGRSDRCGCGSDKPYETCCGLN